MSAMSFSDADRVMLTRKLEARSIPEPNSGCLLWTGVQQSLSAGYGVVVVRGRVLGAHRIAWALHNRRDIPGGMFVCHKCDVPACINPDHLFIGTPAMNMVDRDSKKRQARGNRNGNSKLTGDQVRAIRSDPRSVRAIARNYSVGRMMVNYIKRGVYWRHLQ